MNTPSVENPTVGLRAGPESLHLGHLTLTYVHRVLSGHRGRAYGLGRGRVFLYMCLARKDCASVRTYVLQKRAMMLSVAGRAVRGAHPGVTKFTTIPFASTCKYSP